MFYLRNRFTFLVSEDNSVNVASREFCNSIWIRTAMMISLCVIPQEQTIIDGLFKLQPSIMCSIFKYSVSVGSTFTKSNFVSFKKLNWFAIDLNITLGCYNVLLIGPDHRPASTRYSSFPVVKCILARTSWRDTLQEPSPRGEWPLVCKRGDPLYNLEPYIIL